MTTTEHLLHPTIVLKSGSYVYLCICVHRYVYKCIHMRWLIHMCDMTQGLYRRTRSLSHREAAPMHVYICICIYRYMCTCIYLRNDSFICVTWIIHMDCTAEHVLDPIAVLKNVFWSHSCTGKRLLCMYIYVYVCVCMRMYVYVCVCMCMYVSIRGSWLILAASMYLCVYMCLFVSICVHMCIYAYICV